MLDDTYEVLLAEEKAVTRVQTMLLRLLDHTKTSRTELAGSLGVSTAHIAQLLDAANPPNLSLRKVARLMHALGEELVVSTPTIAELDRKAVHQQQLAKARAEGAYAQAWTDCSVTSAQTSRGNVSERQAA